MKKPTQLRPQTLSAEGLRKVSGGRGVIHGYTECLDCRATTPEPWPACPQCGAPFDPLTGTYNGAQRQFLETTVSFQ